MSNQNGKFEYKEMKIARVTDYTDQTPTKHFGWKKCLSSTALKIRKYYLIVHKIGSAHVRYMNNL